MAKIIFITGGQRSGKSRYAKEKALSLSANPVYLATARSWDDDFRQRIERHKADRGPQWRNMEEPKNIAGLKFKSEDVVLIDCITLWLTNIFHDNQFDTDKAYNEALSQWDEFIKQDFTVIAVTNELGMSIHSETEAGRKFTDLQGWMNQHIASTADEAWLMVSGMGVKLK
jgi:adenosylcobinamide kinase / adenosylcobinamide-phosphate guanylyltransferase